MVMAQRKAYAREFKLEVVRLIWDPGVSFAQTSRHLSFHSNSPRAALVLGVNYAYTTKR